MSPIDALIVRFEAPLMSFGGAAVDERRVTRDLPARSMVTGLLANALGWHHRDWAALGRLQERLRYAVRRDRPGQLLRDFHTVDLGQPFMQRGWTTWGRPEGRGGASAGGTHIRLMDYLADAAYTLALTLDPAAEDPTLDHLERALRQPARPLFLGRKCCLPSRPLLDADARIEAASLPHALAATPPLPPVDSAEELSVWWPDEGELPASFSAQGSLELTEDRDWENQKHEGWRIWHTGRQRVEDPHV